MPETLKGQHQTESKCLENIKTHTNTNTQNTWICFCVYLQAFAHSLSSSYTQSMSLGERNIETTTKSLAPSGWRATSFCVSVTTSLISFNYFNCFYMNNSSIFPILYGLDCAVWCFAGCYCFVFCFCWQCICTNTCETYMRFQSSRSFHFSFVFVLSRMSIWCDLFHINFDFNSTKRETRDLFCGFKWK